MNVYDAATPAGREPAAGGEPRRRAAVPGSALDGVYASRYHLIGTDTVDGVQVDVTAETGPASSARALAALAAAAIADETPPDARRPKE